MQYAHLELRDRLAASAWPAVLAWAALILHGVAFVAFGRSNDESFYLAAVRHVQDGLVPYRDFCFPQGPVMPFVYAALTQLLPGGRLLAGRVVSLSLTIAAVGLLAALAARSGGRRVAILVVATVALNPFLLHLLTLVKTYALVSFLLAASFTLLAAGSRGLVGAAVLLTLATATRLVMAPLLVWLFVWGAGRSSRRTLISAGAVSVAVLWGTLGSLEIASDGRLHRSLYVPLAGAWAPNAVTAYHVTTFQDDDPGASADRKLSHILRSALAFGLPVLTLLPAIGSRLGIAVRSTPFPAVGTFAGGAAALLAAAHLVAHRPYDEYQTVTFVALLGFVALSTRASSPQRPDCPRATNRLKDALAWILAAAAVVSPIWRGVRCLDVDPAGAVPGRVRTAGETVRRWTGAGGRVLALDAVVSVECGRPLHPLLAMGQFAYRPEWSTSDCTQNGFLNASLLIDAIRDGGTGAVMLAREDLTDGPADRRAWRARLRAGVESALRSGYRKIGMVPGARAGRPLDVWIRTSRTHVTPIDEIGVTR